MAKTDRDQARPRHSKLDFTEDLIPKLKQITKQQTETDEKEPSQLAGRISGTMEDLERLQSTEMAATDEVKACIKDSLECFQNCTKTSRQCISRGGKYVETKTIKLLMDCAKICNVNADFMLRDSTYYPQICGLAADICDECSDNCDRFDEPFMRECAGICRRCSESCREMAR